MKTFSFLLAVLTSICFNGFSQKAIFTYEYHNDQSKGGKFIFSDETHEENSFEAPASAGHLDAANNPYTQSFRDMGPIPSGTWEISSIKNESKAILRITPTDDVITNGRSGFLIHGYGQGQDAADASTGCIILENQYRQKLMAALLEYGSIKLIVQNKVY